MREKLELPAGYLERTTRALNQPLFHGWDGSLEDPSELGLWLLTPERDVAADINALGVVAQEETATIVTGTADYAAPAGPAEVYAVALRLGLTPHEIAATGVDAETIQNFGPLDNAVTTLKLLPTEMLLRVPRLRDTLTSAGYDSAIGWATVSNFEVPFVAGAGPGPALPFPAGVADSNTPPTCSLPNNTAQPNTGAVQHHHRSFSPRLTRLYSVRKPCFRASLRIISTQ